MAEGTPAALKAEIGRPSVHAIPQRDADREKIAAFLAQFGEPLATTRDVAVRLRDGLGLTDIVRAVDADGVQVADLELRAPTLDDVFLAKTGRTLEGAAEEAGGRGSGASRLSAWPQVGAIARRSVVRTLAPAGELHPAAHLPDRADDRERRQAWRRRPSFPASRPTRSSPSRSPSRSSRARSSRR